MFDVLAVAGEGFGAVAAFGGAVEFAVGFGESGGHGQRVVEVGERAGAVEGFTRGENGAGFGLYPSCHRSYFV